MRYFVGGWVRDAEGGFRPSGVGDPPWSCLDFRPDPSVADGFCVVAVPDDVVSLKGGMLVAADKTERLSAVRARAFANRVGLTLEAQDFSGVLLELFQGHSSPVADKSRWNPLVPTIEGRWEIWLGNEKLVDLPAVSGGATLSDPYTAGRTLTWDNVCPFSSNLTATSNALQPSTSSAADNIEATNTALNSAAHYAQTTVSSASTSANARWGASVRCNAGSNNAYFGYMDGSGAWAIKKLATLAASTLTSGSGLTKANGDLIRLEGNGTTLTLYQNGVSVGSTTDGTYTTQKNPGVYCYSNTGTAADGRIDDFTAADLSTLLYRPRDRQVAAVRRNAYW